MAYLSVLIVTFMLLKSHSCWIINDINTKMLDEIHSEDNINDIIDDEDIEAAKLGFKINFIYPGTKWCGAGNIADSYNDLGSKVETDICCREHDHCPDTIAGGDTKYNLTNPLFYTRLSCDCDEKFRVCLKSTKKRAAKIIGNIYFNALKTKCFREDYPVKKCLKKGGWFKRKCLEYDYDMNGVKIYQWFHVQKF